MLKNIMGGIAELVFPDNCFLCRDFLDSGHQRQICHQCQQKITLNTPPFCRLCCRRLTAFCDDGLCGQCRGQTRHYDRVWGACLYADELRLLLHAFKYNGKTGLRRTFNSLLISFVDTYHVALGDFDFVCPIPLHSTRLRERGYNQSEVISVDLCRHYRFNHRSDILYRHAATSSQTALHQKQRWTNLQGAFRISPQKDLHDKSILIVDDLLTTGATADAAARTLKEAGAAFVGVLTLAITE